MNTSRDLYWKLSPFVVLCCCEIPEGRDMSSVVLGVMDIPPYMWCRLHFEELVCLEGHIDWRRSGS